MQSKIKLYLDTSVVSALFDYRNPERQNLTKDFFKELHNFSIYLSVVTLAEIENTPDTGLREQMEDIVMGHIVLSLSDDVSFLVDEYIKFGAVPKKSREDAFHIALATISEMDYLLSWNFKHLLRQKTRKIVHMVNTVNRMRKVEIISPAEIL